MQMSEQISALAISSLGAAVAPADLAQIKWAVVGAGVDSLRR